MSEEMTRHARALTAAFAARLALVALVFSRYGPCLQHGDSISWTQQSLHVAYGLMPAESFFWPPAFRLLLAGAIHVFGYSVAVPMAVNTLLGLAGIALSYRLALLFDPSCAFLCALLTALIPMGSYLSLSGLAEPLCLVFLQLFILAYCVYRQDTRRWRLQIAAAAALAAAVLTRYEALGFYVVFAAMELRRVRGKDARPLRTTVALLAPLAALLFWIGLRSNYWSGRFWSDPLFWVRITVDGNRHNDLSGLGPLALVGYVFKFVRHSYSWYCLAVPAALVGLWGGAGLGEAAAGWSAVAALVNVGALTASASVRLISSDADRNFFIPLVILMPYTAFLLVEWYKRRCRIRSKALSSLAFAALAAAFLPKLTRVTQRNGWCFPRQGPEMRGCELGRILSVVTREVPVPGKSLACYEHEADHSCASAALCSSLPRLATWKPRARPRPSKISYAIMSCAQDPSATLLARNGDKCLYYLSTRQADSGEGAVPLASRD